MKPFSGLIIAAVLAPVLHAQDPFWNTPNAYLREARPSDTPKIFAPGRLADVGMFPLGRVAFSRDGKEFYYSQNNSWESGEQARMKWMRYADDKWAKPVVINEHFVTPTLSFDGGTLYMRKANNMKNVWQSHRIGAGWTDPVPFLEKSFGVYDYMPTIGGNAYVGSDPGPADMKYGGTYVFSILTFTNGDVSVKSLGQPLNAKGWNGDLYVAPDESYMIVSANETQNFESELHLSFRRIDSTWTAPVSLGPKINNGLAHRWGQYVTPDKEFMFYCRGTSEKDCAIWWVRFDSLLASLKPKDP